MTISSSGVEAYIMIKSGMGFAMFERFFYNSFRIIFSLTNNINYLNIQIGN